MSRQGPRGRHRPRRALSAFILLAVVAVAATTVAVGLGLGRQAAERVGLLPIVVPVEYRDLIREAADRCPAVPLEVFAAQIAAESDWDSQARSAAGARGIAQFMPKVWKQYGIDANEDGKTSVWDPEDAIHSAAELNCVNKRLVKGVPGDRVQNILAAYNAGYAAVRKYGGIPPYPETQSYVERILRDAERIEL